MAITLSALMPIEPVAPSTVTPFLRVTSAPFNDSNSGRVFITRALIISNPSRIPVRRR